MSSRPTVGEVGEGRLALKEDEEAAGVSNLEVVIGSNSQVAAAVATAADRTLDD
jgi:hypothetical protein